MFHTVANMTQEEVKILRFPLFVELQRHSMLSGGAQRRTLPRHRSEMKIFIILLFLEWERNPQPVKFTVTRLCPCATTGLVF